MKAETDSCLQEEQDSSAMAEAHLNIKADEATLGPNSLLHEGDKLNLVDALNGIQQTIDRKQQQVPPQLMQSQQGMPSVMHSSNLPQHLRTSLHSLHQGTSVAQMPQLSAAHQHSVDNSACAVPEFELARRLGVRFDSSNAAWVARWTDAQNDRKKSRWFSVAKYGNAPARRLAIQACLHNMKPSDFPSLRDLQDVLATFGHPGAGGGGGYLVPGGDMGGGVRGGGMMDPHHMAGKFGAQFGSQFMHHNPFGAMSGMPNPMAGYAMGPGGLPGLHPGANLGMFVQGVPQQHATQGVAPAGEEGAEGGLMVSSELDMNGQPIIKTQPPYLGETDGSSMHPADPVKQFDQTTTASSSVGSPSAAIKSEDPVAQQSQAASVVLDQAIAAARNSDAAFLQSLAGQPGPTAPGAPRFVMSGDSSSQDSSDLDSRSSGSDDEDDEERAEKRKKRKLDDAGNAENTGMQPGFAQQMSVYNQQGLQQQAGQQGMHPMANGQQTSNYSSYYASLYGAGGQLPFFVQPQMLPMLHPHFQQHAAAAAAGFLPHGHMHSGLDQSQYQHLFKTSQGMYMQQGYGDSPHSPSGDSPLSATSPSDVVALHKRQHNGSQSSGGQQASAKMTCERGLHYSKSYRGSQECWIAVWNTKGGRIMHEAFDVTDLGFEAAKQKAREARDAAHSNNVAVTENSRPSWKSHSNTGIPHVSLDSQQLRFRAHKFGRRLCRSFSFGRRRGSYASRESAFDAAVLWLIQTPTEEEIATVSGCNSKMEEI